MTNMCMSYVLGAKNIRKTFYIRQKKKGNDHYHSMDYKDLKNLRKRISKAKKIIGLKEKNVLKLS